MPTGIYQRQINDLTGMAFGLLRVVSFEKMHHRKAYWKCICSCGKETIVRASQLTEKNNVKSCGCIRYKSGIQSINFKHGDARARIYGIWTGIKNRCFNKNEPAFKNYGGKGVSVFPAWLNYVSFRDWALSHGYKENLTIDRINQDGNYEPGNCEWVTRSENSRRAYQFNKQHKRGKWAK